LADNTAEQIAVRIRAPFITTVGSAERRTQRLAHLDEAAFFDAFRIPVYQRRSEWPTQLDAFRTTVFDAVRDSLNQCFSK